MRGPAGRLCLLTAAILSLACGCSPDPPPNIVFLLTDDQPTSSFVHMPKLDQLVARRGTTFPNFLLNDPLCCPSRVTMMLGQYRHNHQIEFGQPFGCAYRFFSEGLPERGIGALMSAAGIRTGFIGKYLNSYDRYLNHVDADRAGALARGWEWYQIGASRRYFDYVIHANGELVHYARAEEDYETDTLASLAEDFIAESAALERPFFLYLATNAPHGPRAPAPRHRGLEVPSAPRPPSFNEPDVRDKAPSNRPPLLDAAQIARLDTRYRATLQMLQSVDDLVERVVAALESAEQLERTYLFFTTDNGFHFGEHRLEGGKSTPYEESVRVPLVVMGPGVARGVVRDELVANVDLLPTFLDLVGRAAPAHVDGRSLRPLLDASMGSSPWRRAFALELLTENAKRNRGTPPFAALRTDRYKLIEYANGERELYDLASDPHELGNLFPTGGAIAGPLSERLRDLLACAGERCREIEDRELDLVTDGS